MLAGQASGPYQPFPVTKHFLVFPDQGETLQKLHVFYRTTGPHMKAERQTSPGRNVLRLVHSKSTRPGLETT